MICNRQVRKLGRCPSEEGMSEMKAEAEEDAPVLEMGPVADKGLLADVYPMSTTRHNMFGWRYDAGVCAAKGCGPGHTSSMATCASTKSKLLHRERERLRNVCASSVRELLTCGYVLFFCLRLCVRCACMCAFHGLQR
jgi:hypothetical protein